MLSESLINFYTYWNVLLISKKVITPKGEGVMKKGKGKFMLVGIKTAILQSHSQLP
jgi:hypothetical protein